MHVAIPAKASRCPRWDADFRLAREVHDRDPSEVPVTRMFALVPALALLTACPPEEVACTDIAMSSVTLTVTDAAGNAIPGATATFSVDGAAAEPCEAMMQGTIVCGYERAGHFDIVISAEGFVDGAVSADVTADECHVQGVTETVVLELDELECTTEAVGSVALTVMNGGAPVDADLAQFRVRSSGTLQDCDRSGVGTYTCGYEVAGELEVFAELDGERIATRATVEAGECHVTTVSASLDFAPEACTDNVASSVVVTTYDVDVPTDVDAVTWGLANADMMPQPCTSFGDGVYGCGQEVAGLIEITAALGDASRSTTVEVLQGECHVLTEDVGLVFGAP